jgi:YebC/PmpR family DNA-binding regulatory protein
VSGHSKWSTIKRKKGAKDAARGKAFTRLIREISIAARDGGDPDSNTRLRTAIAAAKAANMPNDNIERAIKKGTGELEGAGTIEEVIYEGYGPLGVAVLAETATDNRNRTTSELRHIFTKHGGNLGAVGSVAWMFDQKGIIAVNKESIEEDELLEAALDAGAEDLDTEIDDRYQVVTAPGDLHRVMASLEKKGVAILEAGLDRIPQTTKSLGEEDAVKFLKFYEMIEDQDDVQKAFANFEIPDEVMEKLGA